MRRVFNLIVICAFASVWASGAHAQARRVRRTPPPEERAGKSETKDAAKDETESETKDKDAARDRPQDAATADDDEPLPVKEVTERAVIKSKPNPDYPREARAYGVQGQVKLRIILGADGKVREQVEVLGGLPYGVTEEAIQAARRIKFEPARKGGRPVSQYVTVVYNFHLH